MLQNFKELKFALIHTKYNKMYLYDISTYEILLVPYSNLIYGRQSDKCLIEECLINCFQGFRFNYIITHLK